MNFYFFDLDGTLEDSRTDMVTAAQMVRSMLGLSVKKYDELVPFVNKGMTELYLNCFKEYVRSDDGTVNPDALTKAEKLYLKTYGDQIAVHTKLYPGIEKVLRMSQSSGRTAVITNKPESLSKSLLASLGVAAYVDLVVGGDTCSAAKPSPIPLKYAFETLGGQGEPTRVFMIGDSQGDSTAGAAFGATTVWCAWGYQSDAPTQPAPQHIATTPENLIDILKIKDI